jgi:hypothetical protein
MKNLFKEYLEYPTKPEEKWLMVGFFQCAFIFLLLALPLFAILGQIQNTIQLSIVWFALMGGVLGWSLAILFTVKYWIKLTHNLSLLMYLSSEKADARRKLKTSSNHKQETEETK